MVLCAESNSKGLLFSGMISIRGVILNIMGLHVLS